MRARGLELSAIGPGDARVTFPRAFLPRGARFSYESPDSAALAAEVEAALSVPVTRGGVGMNHTVWQPLLHLRPQADVPVVQLALPFERTDEGLFELGRGLAPLRERGVWLLCSGNLTHNLAQLRVGGEAPAWARRFDAWTAERLEARDASALVDWRRAAPDAYLAHPDDGGHFDVLLVGLGAAADGWRASRFPVEGFETAGMSKRCVQLD